MKRGLLNQMLSGKSPETVVLKRTIKKVAKLRDNVLIVGELGTGKTLVARLIHELSDGKNRPFVTINCPAVGETITEQDLLGEIIQEGESVKEKTGLLENANGGTLFLRYVEKLKPEFQDKIYSIISEKKILKPGASEPIEVNFRVISSAQSDPIGWQDDIPFSKPLYQELAKLKIFIPALRERKQDVPYLFSFFLEKYCKEFGKPEPSIPYEIMEAIMDYDWPGNIGELENCVKNLVSLSPQGKLSAEYLPMKLRKHPFELLDFDALPTAVQELEKFILRKALSKFEGNFSRIARFLRVSESTVRYKVKKYGLEH
ncbi:hypothetical protein DRQ15_04955 [candidate division KSB1 bacterium]|nr:MAG: hypothetical protein DRQ00_11705 [candidate division KSB1 bacterium]RKY78760.1 MAG: hypothetical protein DRQ12_05315 [candidate division KSB1 bacterium]RKY86631.1 MAG: hypothetical protein DRQ11_08070 [candidate division KSB1 bacterium]RKY91440.1 MAG: hypothetical protein DRQ15_04955 [candidate division KSB1 bacterium]